MKRILLIFPVGTLAFLLVAFAGMETSRDLLPYKNPELPVEERVKDLLSRMTVEEKVAQTQCIWKQKSSILDDK